MLLGLAGDSASGKSTLSRGIEYVLGVGGSAAICTDDYHRYDRAERARAGRHPLEPRRESHGPDGGASRDSWRRAARSPSRSTTITPEPSGPKSVDPGEIVIVEGLLPLADRGSRDAIDVAVFLEPDEILRRRWKLERDVFERGYSPR